MGQKILIVEDNVLISRSIESKLKEEMFEVKAVFDGEEAIKQFDIIPYDAVLLDLMLPKVSGENVLKHIRSKGDVPVIIISTKDTDVEKAINLGLGADDYLAKPFSMLELIARVKAVLRRAHKVQEKETKQKFTIGTLDINLSSFEVKKNDHVIDLTLKEFEILKLLLTHPDQTFSKQQMYRTVWGEEYYYNDNVINVHIRRLREKIEDDPSNPKIVITMWGFGYKLGDFAKQEL
ncbi:MAG: DNA-binding response regulator [Tenericutes bacterium GWC2_34_14]|nr:MAG: DNA-binding response regulator [Tenericutes bacterium GWA2_35_7]OHE28610.1 MAG: DNA-binding response regulator [Tenericutes bacterium GWC2_34_14]OHE33482.1 MAG: DNA-binding response regulator [Tenericutes bacterium GWE2_34_108]OHE36767.1 MAG: DNA-binding response regulator [Tenericutes bacterium GWF1_35_14]OHE38153.1 MAG: DNA-binding response regulator [Tenericutes bacterium GWF2_35_184]OHE43329.1 MAG: DNA-binding response regulator [Tenericutes bacterium RIFOXYA2_FULL_36_32]OHE45383.